MNKIESVRLLNLTNSSPFATMTKINKNSNNKKFRYGSNNPNWKGGRRKKGNYWYIYKPDHPFASPKFPYIAEHRLVYEEYYNCILLSYTHLHHIDGNTENNSIENLQPLFTAQHNTIEHTKDMSNRYCLLCGSSKTYYEKKRKIFHWHRYKNGFICRKCYSKKYYRS